MDLRTQEKRILFKSEFKEKEIRDYLPRNRIPWRGGGGPEEKTKVRYKENAPNREGEKSEGKLVKTKVGGLWEKSKEQESSQLRGEEKCQDFKKGQNNIRGHDSRAKLKKGGRKVGNLQEEKFGRKRRI